MASIRASWWLPLLACVLVLGLAQVLMGALSLSALDGMIAGNTADRVALVLRQEGAAVQAGLDLGKPMAQYSGLEAVLQRLQARIPELQGASVVLPEGEPVATLGAVSDATALLGRLPAAPPAVLTVPTRDAVQVALPLREADAGRPGALVASVALDSPARQALLGRNLSVLLTTTAAAAVLLMLALGAPRLAAALAVRPRLRKAVPVVVLLGAQLVYGASTVASFRAQWLAVTQDNVEQLAQGAQRDLDKVLGYGIAIDRLVGVEKYLQRILDGLPVIALLQIRDAGDGVVAQVGARDAVTSLRLPLHAGAQEPVQGWLAVGLDEDQLRAGLRQRILDAATVALVAVIATLELLRVLDLLVRDTGPGRAARRAPAAVSQDTAAGPSPDLVRPLMFGFLLAWALPLSFLPVHARGLIAPGTPADTVPLLMALPITVEMAGGLAMALLAGRMSARSGWLSPVLAGLLLSVLGSLLCMGADSLMGFTLARALVGLGYGLAWMGLQAFVVLNGSPARHGRNMANAIAGLFAGHLCGAAVGAMLMQQLGARAVFEASAIAFCLPALGVLWIAYRFGVRSDRPVALPAQPRAAAHAGIGLRGVLFSRDFGVLLLASIVPFSVAQLGLLTYALPLVMEAAGAPTASVGRVLMLYGLCMIYLGPTMGRLADGSRHKARWIAAAGLTGSAGLLVVGLVQGVPAVVAGVLCLAMAGCLAGGAQVAYMLSLARVQAYGTVRATSLMRAADKIGQMLGPLLVAALFSIASLSFGLLMTGAIYLACTLAFMLLVPSRPDDPGRSAPRAP